MPPVLQASATTSSGYGFRSSIPTTNPHLHHQLPLSLLPLPPNSIPPSRRRRRTLLHASPENLAPPLLADTSAEGVNEQLYQSPTLNSASDVVRNFYAGINRHDLASVEPLIALNCVYEDLVFPKPFVGRKAIMEFFQSFIDNIGTDLQFAIDDISEEDSSAVGVTWHLEWNGRPFPFSRGCSFYRLEVVNGTRQITYARDCVEPAIKTGESALSIIRGVTWLLEKFPTLAERL